MTPKNPLVASRKGVVCRRARSDLKRELKAGTKQVSEVLYEPTLPDHLRTMPLHELLGAVPFLTPSVYEPMLEGVPIKLTALCSEPTYRKRRELIQRLQAWEQRKCHPEKSNRRTWGHEARLSGAAARAIAGYDWGEAE